MTRDDGVKALRALPGGDNYRYLELLVNGELSSVTIEHVARPLWRVVGKSWQEVLRRLSEEPVAR